MGPLAAAFYGHPSRHLDVVGVTGTNGKTTTVHLLRSILDGEPAGRRRSSARSRARGRRRRRPSSRRNSRRPGTRGDRVVAMEVSSHALALQRVDGTRFAVAVFTNLSRDHLDFHPTMSEYFQAKARLFTAELSERAVVNLDDPYGRLLSDAATVPTVGYSIGDASDLRIDALGSRFRWRGVDVSVPIGGRFNVSNAIAGAHGGDGTGRRARRRGPRTGSRRRRSPAGSSWWTPASRSTSSSTTPTRPTASISSSAAAREIAEPHRVIVVFGAGGDRDPTKRPAMGEVAARRADRVVLTSDNPRGEDPGAIIAAVKQGVHDVALTVEPDRRAAIATALAEAQPGDVVVIAGKGHETTQTIGSDVLPFDDRVVARLLLEAHGVVALLLAAGVAPAHLARRHPLPHRLAAGPRHRPAHP